MKTLCKLTIFLFCTGCALGPNFCRPVVTTPSDWQVAELNEEPPQMWWTLFGDPLLSELIEESIACNFDSQIATVRIKRARAARKEALSAAWPHIGLDFDAARFHLSDDFPLLTTSSAFNVFDASFDAHWEIDLFGKAKRGSEAVEAAFAAEIERKRATTLTLIAEVARAYNDLRRVQGQILLLEESLEIERSLLEATKLQQKEQLIGSQRALQIKQQMHTQQEQLIALRAFERLAKNGLAYLVTGLPGSLDERLSCYTPLHPFSHPLAVGLPSTLLCRRPDVRAAEQALAIKTAQVGLSMSDFFPKFDLLADVGYLSQKISQLFQNQSYTALYNFFTRWPIFEGGRLLARFKIAKAEQQEALLEYCKIALFAFHDVDNALISYQSKQEQLCQVEESLRDNQILLENSEALYREQFAPKSAIDQAILSSLEVKTRLIDARAALFEQYIVLYKALGGGWECFDH